MKDQQNGITNQNWHFMVVLYTGKDEWVIEQEWVSQPYH